MYNSSAAFSSSNTEYKNRLFIYEVEGLSRNSVDTQTPIRSSGTVHITVPYSRMNQEMRRINSLGGKVI
ncbi:MAG: phycobilisome linker polypeptide, partial [Cyanobacteria bacterium J06649_11]